MNSNMNTSAVPPLVRNEPSIMMPVKIAHPSRYQAKRGPDGPVFEPNAIAEARNEQRGEGEPERAV